MNNINKKILTISVAAYNVENTIENTLKSVTECDDILNKIEIIVVNDGSKDSTVQKVNKYKECYPSVVFLVDKKNGGYGSTINESLKIANGKYFKLLDGDDTFETSNLLQYINYLEKVDDDIVISSYNEIHISTGEKNIIEQHKKKDNKESWDDIKSDIMMHEISVKTSVLRDNNIKISENCFYTDNEFVFSALIYSRTFSIFSLPIYNYYLGQEGQSVSVEGIRKHYKDTITVANKICTLFSICCKQGITMSKVLERKINSVVRNVYGSYFVIDVDGKMKQELISYDRSLKKNFAFAYKITMKEKKIFIFRMFNYMFYKYICDREQKLRK